MTESERAVYFGNERLDGKVAVVTGASAGIGEACALALAEVGASVVVTARRRDRLEAVAARIRERGGTARVHVADVASLEDVRSLTDATLGALGRIDILVNNAGIFPHECDDINDLDFDAFERVLRTNTMGPLLLTKALTPNLERSDRKLVVSISSNLGSITDASKGQAGFMGYHTSKAALNMANTVMAHQLKPKGITSVVIHPGWVQTDMGGPQAPLTPDKSTSSIVKTIEGLSAKDSGRFVDYKGDELPW